MKCHSPSPHAVCWRVFLLLLRCLLRYFFCLLCVFSSFYVVLWSVILFLSCCGLKCHKCHRLLLLLTLTMSVEVWIFSCYIVSIKVSYSPPWTNCPSLLFMFVFWSVTVLLGYCLLKYDSLPLKSCIKGDLILLLLLIIMIIIIMVIMCSFLCHFSFRAQDPLHETK